MLSSEGGAASVCFCTLRAHVEFAQWVPELSGTLTSRRAVWASVGWRSPARACLLEHELTFLLPPDPGTALCPRAGRAGQSRHGALWGGGRLVEASARQASRSGSLLRKLSGCPGFSLAALLCPCWRDPVLCAEVLTPVAL